MNANPNNSNTPLRDSLSDEQLSELLAVPAKFASDETAEVASLRAALDDYRAEMLQWAERRSSVQTSLVAAAQRSRFWSAIPQWSLAAVAVVAVAAGTVFVTGNHVTSNPAAEETAMTASAPAPKADIAEDNRLLNSIDQELSFHSTHTPVDGFGLSATHGDTKPATRSEVTD